MYRVMTQPDLDLGVVGNGSFGALIDKHARVVWSCLPTFDVIGYKGLIDGFEAKYGITRETIKKVNIKGVFQIWTHDGEYHEVPVVLGELPDEDGEEDHGWCDFDNAW